MDFDRLVDRHKDAVYRQMIRVCGDRDDAEDVLMEALLRAHEAASSLKEEAAFRSWLGTVGKRICYRFRAHGEMRPFLQLEESELEERAGNEPAMDDDIEAARLKSCVKDALATLPEEQRQIIELRDLEGLSGEEAAERLGISVAAMKSRLHRARKSLRDLLDESLIAS